MSTTSRLDENQAYPRQPSVNGPDGPKLPALRDDGKPAIGGELSDEKRRRLEELAEWANAAHEQAKDAALRFCRHSVQAGMALLEAQDICPKRAWGAWLAEHFDGCVRTAQRYMQQAKSILPLRGSATDLSQNPPEDLALSFANAVKRLDRQRAQALLPSEAAAGVVAAEKHESSMKLVEVSDHLPSPSETGDPLAATLGLFDELLAALERDIESGQWLDYGPFVLGELERIRVDVDACRSLLGDARRLSTAVV